MEDLEFWPPPDFLTDYEILMEETNNAEKNGLRTQLIPNLCFPAEFPVDCGSSASPSALNSPVDSALVPESESDEEDLLAGLTRRLTRSTLQETHKLSSAHQTFEKNCGSPKSTLMTVGSWSGRSTVSSNRSYNGLSQVPSPPTSPFETNIDAWDLIYEEAGQVTRLKISRGGAAKPEGLQCPTQMFSSQVHSLLPVRNPNFALHSNQRTSHTPSQMNHFQRLGQEQMAKQQGSDCWGLHTEESLFSQIQVAQNRIARLDGSFSDGGRCGRPLCLPQTPWPGLQAQNNYGRQCQNQQLRSGSDMRTTFLGGSGVGMKRERTGTGVFLPRRYNKPAESRKKQGIFSDGSSTAMIPAKVIPAQTQCLPPPRVNSATISDRDLMVQRNAILGQQRRFFCSDSATGQEICLPQEWTY